MKSKRPSTAGDRPKASDASGPALPVWKAFVVQFSRETGAQGGTFAGRVEHMSSGRQARFASTQDLVAVLQHMIEQLGQEGG